MADISLPLVGQQVQVTLGVPNVGWRMHIVLPALQAQANIADNWLWRFNIRLPQLQASAYGGGVFDIPLPMLTANVGITIPNNMRFNAQLPMLAGAVTDVDPATSDSVWVGSIGFVWHFAITLPRLDVDGQFGGWRFRVTLPMLTSPQDGVGGGAMCGACASGGLLTNFSIHVKLPRLKAKATFTAPVAGYRFFVVLPALAMSHGLTGGVLLPALRASARFSTPLLPGQSVSYRGWAMNLQNSAVTEFAGFNFRAMAFAYNQHYGVGFDGGLYRMGGDDDAGMPIKWAWESGLDDLGVNAQKGLLALYVDGLFDNTATFSIQTDGVRRVYGHRARGNVYNHQPHRVPLGKGVRTRNVAIGMADEEGGYLELDKITPEYHITQRNL